MNRKWERPHEHADNLLLDGEGFFVSFNPSPWEGSTAFGSDGGGSETALKADGKPYLILNGDFRDEYEAAAPNGYDACVAVYAKHKATSRSSWSEDAEEAAV